MASRSLNRVILIGNLTRDPELKYTPAGTAVCTFGVATNRSWTTADGSTKEEVQYHRIVAWQKLAELCGKLLTKGRKIFLEGRLTYRSFTGKDGQQKSITEIVLDDFIVFSDGKRLIETEVKNEKEQSASEAKVQVPEDSIKPEKSSTEASEEKKDESVNPDDIPF
jgi:single-strand DNA-binding protein